MALALAAAAVAAMLTAPPAAAEPVAHSRLEPAVRASGAWIVMGGALTATRRGCQLCDTRLPTRHAAGVLADFGYAIDERTAVAAEIFWIPVTTPSRRTSTTHVDAVAQFRPWRSRGFFVKGGAGMAFVHNSLDDTDASPTTSKALSMTIGAGWTLNPGRRVALQLLAAQHAAALGDLPAAGGQVNDVLNNSWSAGVALRFR